MEDKKTNIGQEKPKFLQPEPEEINETDLQNVAGGAACTSSYSPTDLCPQ